MKEIYLVRNKLLGNYLFAEGLIIDGIKPYEDPAKAKYLGFIKNGDLFSFLKSNVDSKRKSILYLENLLEGTSKQITDLFRNTKVKVVCVHSR